MPRNTTGSSGISASTSGADEKVGLSDAAAALLAQASASNATPAPSSSSAAAAGLGLSNLSSLPGLLQGGANAALLDSLINQEQRRQALLASLQLSSSNQMGGANSDILRSLLLQQALAGQTSAAAPASLGLSSLDSFGLAGLGLNAGLSFNPASLLNRDILPSAGLSQLLAAQQQQAQQQQMSPAMASLPDAEPVATEKRKGRTGTFPQKLHQMLSDLEQQEGGTDIASFLPHGRAFAIHDPKEFVKTVMPKYFRMSRFSSFQRQLNLYEFQRVTEGPNKGSYYHELFVKGRPMLCTHIKRNKIKSDNPTNRVRDPFGPLGPGMAAASLPALPPADQGAAQPSAGLTAAALLQSLSNRGAGL